MKAVSTPAVALLLALSVAVGTVSNAQADVMSKMNPVRWFSSESPEDPQAALANQQAREQAAEAQVQADQALKAAQEALYKAGQAKKQAEALQTQARHAKKVKPVVTTPESEVETEAASKLQSAPEAEATEAAAPEAAAPQRNWNPLRLMKRAESVPTEKETQAAEAPLRPANTQAAEPPSEPTAVQATVGDTAAESKPGGTSTPWNPLTWFAKPAATDAATTASAAPQAVETESPKTPTASGEVDLKTKAAIIETEKGNITFELYPDQAPITVNNFAKLINEGFYNRFNMKFHRVVPGFVVQTGDPTGTGAGGSKERIPLEAKNKLSHNAKGVVAMARGADPNSATSQFYITLTPQTSLDGKYTIFGKVIAGMSVLEKIEKDDMMYGIRLIDIDTVVRDAGPEKKKFFSSVF